MGKGGILMFKSNMQAIREELLEGVEYIRAEARKSSSPGWVAGSTASADLMEARIKRLIPRAAAKPDLDELRGMVIQLRDEVMQLNRRILELSLNASVRMKE